MQFWLFSAYDDSGREDDYTDDEQLPIDSVLGNYYKPFFARSVRRAPNRK